MSDFQTFIESIQHVPTEFERSINLVRELDTRVYKLINEINELHTRYKQTRSQAERADIRKKLGDFTNKVESYGFDISEKIEQTYTLIDNTICTLLLLANGKSDAKPLGLEMPVDPDEPKYCYCRSVSYGQMIACDNIDCSIEWFHIGCARLKSIPQGKWYCDQCKVLAPLDLKKNRRRRR